MSIRDGNVPTDNLYTTTDMALAAYLMTRGYELLGAIDSGERVKEFGLTHTDPYVLKKLEADVLSKAQEYEGMFLPIPHDPGNSVNFKVYYKNLRTIYRALDDPIRRD